MHTTVSPEIKEILHAVHYRPSISIIIPFEPKMSPKASLAHTLRSVVKKVEKELEEKYPNELGKAMTSKLNRIIPELNYNTHKKSIAIFISPVFEKILYLDLPVEEKIIIDESFEIRDLVYCKKQSHKFLVLLLSARESKMYLANENTLTGVISHLHSSTHEHGLHGTDPAMDNFLHETDNSLSIIRASYQLPLFVIGTDKIVGHFKTLTKNTGGVIDYIHGSHEDATMANLQQLLEPYLRDWEKVHQKDLMNKLEEAAGKKRLVSGIRDVWQEAMNHKGQLLVVEKNYMYPAKDEATGTIDWSVETPGHFSYVKDAVDDIIEKVIEHGGDVEFAEEGFLKEFHHIALIKYY